MHDFSRDFSQGDDGERKGSASAQGRADRLNGIEDKIGADVDTFVREAQDAVSIVCVCVWGGGACLLQSTKNAAGSMQTRVRACPETRPASRESFWPLTGLGRGGKPGVAGCWREAIARTVNLMSLWETLLLPTERTGVRAYTHRWR